jgi:hypothetical protein
MTALTGRTTLVLLGVMTVLVAYVWLVELRPRQRESVAAPPEPALLPVPPDAVARIDFQEGGRVVTAVRSGGRWTDGTGRPWRDDAVADLVGTLGSLRPVMIVDEAPREPAEYGLGPGAPRLAVATAGGRSVLALEIGEANPAGTGIYARRDGAPEVMLLGGILTWELDKLRNGDPAH